MKNEEKTAKLRAENAELREENAELRRQVQELTEALQESEEALNGTLQRVEELGKKKGTALMGQGQQAGKRGGEDAAARMQAILEG
jgi:uncharacterized coiled-coil DUF342 family protein